MKREHVQMVGVMVMVSLLWFVPGVLAEPFVGVYGGLSLAPDSDFKDADIVVPTAPEFGNMSAFFRGNDLKTKLDNSGTFGARVGYWFDAFPMLGVAFDVYTFFPNFEIPQQNFDIIRNRQTLGTVSLVEHDFDVTVTTLGFSGLGRLSLLKGPDYPRGRLQPYLGIGPALFITSWDDQQDTPEMSAIEEPFDIGSDTVVNGGLQIMVGAKFFLLEKLAVFGEYKFTHHVAQIGGIDKIGEETILGSGSSIVGKQPFNISHLVFGLSYSFY